LDALLAAQLELLIPGRIRPGSNRGYADIEQVRLATSRCFDTTSQGFLQVVWGRHLGAVDALGFGQHDEVNLGVAKIDLRILVLLDHIPTQGRKVCAHRLVIQVVPTNGENRQTVACHGPEPRRTVHHGPITEAAYHWSIWGS